MHVHTVIVGAGPGGLACAGTLAKAGIQPLVLERKETVGPKVCAGGITWGGLISRVPKELAEKSFPEQYIRTPLQKICIKEPTPIIATVNRERLGQHMASTAVDAGAELRCGVMVRKIENGSLLLRNRADGKEEVLHFDYLVGADGSSSLVRRHLGLAAERLGIGINYQIPGDTGRMEWHLNTRRFGNGYAWIFPHATSISIGAYAAKETMDAGRLKKNLIDWAAGQGFDLRRHKARAEYINYDFRGWNFGRSFLVGDAAGLASGLTGEGIYPAILSGEEVARTIADASHSPAVMNSLIRNHARHSRMVKLSGKSRFLNAILAELVTLGLRSGMIRFNKLEMAV